MNRLCDYNTDVTEQLQFELRIILYHTLFEKYILAITYFHLQTDSLSFYFPSATISGVKVVPPPSRVSITHCVQKN